METLSLEGWSLAMGSGEHRAIAGPMTVAAALRSLGEWSFDRPRNFDEATWWFRAQLPPLAAGDVLRLDGLATLAEVFLDDRSVLKSDNMYHAHVVELPGDARVLTIRFDPVAAALAQKRPRPRWKTRLTSHQQLRWIRTSLVGRMPGWSPPVAPVGPWRRVVVERRVPSARISMAGTDTDRDIARYLHNASALAAHPVFESAPAVAVAPRAGLLTGTLPSLQSTGSAPALNLPDSGSLETIRELAPPSPARAAAESSAYDTSTSTLRGANADSKLRGALPVLRSGVAATLLDAPAVSAPSSEAMTAATPPALGATASASSQPALGAAPHVGTASASSQPALGAASHRAGPPRAEWSRELTPSPPIPRSPHLAPTLHGPTPAPATLKGFAPAAITLESPAHAPSGSAPQNPALPNSALAEQTGSAPDAHGLPTGFARAGAHPGASAGSTFEPASSEPDAHGLPTGFAPPIPSSERETNRLLPTSAPDVNIPPAAVSSSPVTGRLATQGANAPLPADASVRIHATVDGTRGVVVVSAPYAGTFVIADQRVVLAVDGDRFSARIEIPDVELWWPHTHGPPKRYAARLESAYGVTALELAFRTIALDTTGGRFALSVNGVPLFCRGAVWTSLDIVTLTSTPAEYARALGLVRDAGMNMLRLSGTLFYEADAFYETCDALGILVWQDFMFANMDYPADDSAFRASVEREARQFLERTRHRACLAMLCGGSEVEQQAAMFGADRAIWRSPLFAELLPAICTELRPDIPYWPSSPAGGALPFHVNEGAAHYYGVGAYLRPFEDARRANVSFASECLAFANLPEDDLFPIILPDGDAPFVSARWKERSSKDFGSSWDFEDVRDHYVGRLFGVDPARVRYEDPERYIALGRVATGETMQRVLAEFRRMHSTTNGALLWFLQDLWPGAGWGILDSRGEPKSAYWYCRRVMAPRAIFFTDEGANGLYVHVVNDAASPLTATLEVTLYRDGETRTNGGTRDLIVPERTTHAVAVDSLLDRFADSSYAYRFGPPGHDVAIASLRSMSGEPAAELLDAAWLVDFAKPPAGAGLEGTLTPTHVTVTTRRYAQAVKIAVPGYAPADNYFDLAPGRTRTIALRPIPSAKKRSAIGGELSALNVRAPIALKVEPE